MNIFDGLKKNLHNITTSLMAYNTTWENSQTSEVFTVKAHFNDPTIDEDIDGSEYHIARPTMEYFVDQFPRLKELVDDNNSEYVDIEGKGRFLVYAVNKIHDGDTYVAILDKQDD
jgi:hypothetical protein